MEEKKIKKKKLTLTISSNKSYNIPHYRLSCHRKKDFKKKEWKKIARSR